MIGHTIVVEGQEYEVVWAGGEGLVGDRLTKAPWTYEAPSRLYIKTGRYNKKKGTIHENRDESDGIAGADSNTERRDYQSEYDDYREPRGIEGEAG